MRHRHYSKKFERKIEVRVGVRLTPILSLIHRGLIDTAGLAAFARINTLDRFFVSRENCAQICFYRIGILDPNTLLDSPQ